MSIDHKYLASAIQQQLTICLPKHQSAEFYNYALFPTGKLFRSKLIFAFLKDHQLNTLTNNHILLCSSIEAHHTYTLLHDDLPCMDDDDERRGKPAAHIKFGEWQSLLTGDGLLNISYRLLSKIKTNNLNTVLSIYSHALGPKGLIHGQVLDLSEEMNNNFATVVFTHELKTARLIQVSLLLSYLINSKESIQYRKCINIAKLGKAIGIIFQLLDDLSELTQEHIGSHEYSINPWLKFFDESLKELDHQTKKMNSIIKLYKLDKLLEVVNSHTCNTRSQLEESSDHVSRLLRPKKLSPVMVLFDRIC